MPLYPGALALACLLAGHGVRKGSLSTSGAVAALSVGYATLANPVKAFGVTMILFYLVGSRATKIGHRIKATLETDEDHAQPQKQKLTHKASLGGKRDAWQVMCNSLVSALAAVAFRLLYDGDAWRQGRAWCVLDGAPLSSHQRNVLDSSLDAYRTSLPRFLFLLMVGHFACCMGDTLASELGILAQRPPRLILPPFRTVPPGTNGALSIQGTLGSVLGGALIGFAASATLVLLDNPACRPRAGALIAQTVVLGSIGGVGGSALDSLLGATLQRTWYNQRTKQVLLGRLTTTADKRNNNNDWRIITGYDVLSNNAVNFLSSSLTAVLVAVIGILS